MKKFSSTQLRTASNAVYNEVMLKGGALIEHRDRPSMVLVDAKEFERLQKSEIQENHAKFHA